MRSTGQIVHLSVPRSTAAAQTDWAARNQPAARPVTYCGAVTTWGQCAVTPGSVETCKACKAAYRKGAK